MAEGLSENYTVWGDDHSAYGPVDLPTLVNWVEQGRLTADSWVYSAATGVWQKARKVKGLEKLFGGSGDTTRLSMPPKIDPQLLRRVKVLQGLTEEELADFAKLVELKEAPEGTRLIAQGQAEDSLYFILAGRLNVYLPVMGKEVALTTLEAGDFFGDIALLNRGARTADVVAETRCLLAELPSSALDELSRRDAAGCTRFLRALDEALSERIRADNERMAKAMNAARAEP